MNEEELFHIESLCEIYQRQLKEGVITDPERQMYQQCIIVLQRIYKKKTQEAGMLRVMDAEKK